MLLQQNSVLEDFRLSTGLIPVQAGHSLTLFSALFLQKSELVNVHPYLVHKKPVCVFSLYLGFIFSIITFFYLIIKLFLKSGPSPGQKGIIEMSFTGYHS
jgi:hypothetical protein